ncbi:NfeD family protein [Commensalibacter nepenthis]|uniref:NfeD family protein n=1 Tax=Commensalibacter nepenthis TaxID=3043872 RepID=A0ABT6Q5Q7_9PROT|nr:NfeD family protein [Commensalibacter sp. TBRC 10068]MDI2112225.1 NfeD family protein [Commensalibacter sp. TBRC 10068]
MFIDLHTLWLMWIIIGVILLLVELFTTTFFALWMAGAAIVPAILSFFSPNMSLEFQIIVWIIAMCICAFLWMRFSKRDIPLENIDKELIGQIGILAKKCDAQNKGILLLQKPVDGLSQWECIANNPIPVETRVIVVQRVGERLLQVDFEKK